MNEVEAKRLKEFESTLVAGEAVRSVRRVVEIPHETIHRTQYSIWNGKKWCRVKNADLPKWSTTFEEHNKHYFDYDRINIRVKGKRKFDGPIIG